MNTHQELERKLSSLLHERDRFFELGNILCQHKNIHYSDLVFLPFLQSSFSIITGFVSLIKSENYIMACSAIRMLVDVLLRFHAVSLSNNLSDAVAKVLISDNFKKICILDDSGKRVDINAKYLCLDLENKFKIDWMHNVYKSTSGFTHPSKNQLKYIFKDDGDGSFVLSIDIDGKLKNVSQENIDEAIMCMQAVSQILYIHFESYVEKISGGKIFSEY